MSGLAHYEKQGLFDLFKSLDDKTILIQIAKTLTKNYVPIKTLEEGLNIVFLHGGSTTNILNKKLIKKEFLFKYLHSNFIRVPNDFTKTSLVEKTQLFWKEKYDDKNFQNKQYFPSPVEENQISTISSNSQKEELIKLNDAELPETNSTRFPINVLAKKFSDWFFQSYNNNTLKQEDFWVDSTLDLKMIETNTGLIDERECSTNAEAITILLDINKTYNINFNPNLEYEGVQGRLDVHGLVLAICCGTLHTVDLCVGTFESLFGLIRDPNSENNWKIKHMKLVLKSSVAIQQKPCLKDSDTLHSILNLPEPSGNL